MPLIPLFIQNEVSITAKNRISAFNFCNPFDHVLPIADSDISVTDRGHLWGLYAGISAAEIILGPYCVEATDVFTAGAVATGDFNAGSSVSDVFTAGAVITQVGCN